MSKRVRVNSDTTGKPKEQAKQQVVVGTSQSVGERVVIVDGVSLYVSPAATDKDIRVARQEIVSVHESGFKVQKLELSGGPRHLLETSWVPAEKGSVPREPQPKRNEVKTIEVSDDELWVIKHALSMFNRGPRSVGKDELSQAELRIIRGFVSKL